MQGKAHGVTYAHLDSSSVGDPSQFSMAQELELHQADGKNKRKLVACPGGLGNINMTLSPSLVPHGSPANGRQLH